MHARSLRICIICLLVILLILMIVPRLFTAREHYTSDSVFYGTIYDGYIAGYKVTFMFKGTGASFGDFVVTKDGVEVPNTKRQFMLEQDVHDRQWEIKFLVSAPSFPWSSDRLGSMYVTVPNAFVMFINGLPGGLQRFEKRMGQDRAACTQSLLSTAKRGEQTARVRFVNNTPDNLVLYRVSYETPNNLISLTTIPAGGKRTYTQVSDSQIYVLKKGVEDGNEDHNVCYRVIRNPISSATSTVVDLGYTVYVQQIS
jgi:hypothetical protein